MQGIVLSIKAKPTALTRPLHRNENREQHGISPPGSQPWRLIDRDDLLSLFSLSFTFFFMIDSLSLLV